MVVIVQTVGAQQLDEGHILHLRFRDVGQIDACGVALVLDVETELRLLHRRCQVIHVLHHQVPVSLRGVVTGVLQGFDKQRVAGIAMIGSKLAHLVGHATTGIFVGYSQHLVGLQHGTQRDIAK